MKIAELIASLIATAVFAFFFVKSIQMPTYDAFWTGPGAMPAVLCASLMVFSLWWAGDLLWEQKQKKMQAAEPSSDEEMTGAGANWKRLATIVALTFIYTYVLTPLIGFAVATVVFLFVSIFIFGEMHWIKSLLLSGGISLGVYATFNNVLHLPMPR